MKVEEMSDEALRYIAPMMCGTAERAELLRRQRERGELFKPYEWPPKKRSTECDELFMDDFLVLQDHPSLIDYIDGLQRKNAEQLAFYPRQVFEREHEKGRLFLGLLNNEPCGYIYLGAPGVDVKCHQVCIQYDARRRLYGAQLVAVMEQYAEECRAASVTLRCGFDLEANDFWSAMGYRAIAVVDGGVRRMRKINVWRKQIREELFETVAVEAARGLTDASLWRKNKSTGIVTQFARGKALADYRAKLVKPD